MFKDEWFKPYCKDKIVSLRHVKEYYKIPVTVIKASLKPQLNDDVIGIILEYYIHMELSHVRLLSCARFSRVMNPDISKWSNMRFNHNIVFKSMKDKKYMGFKRCSKLIMHGSYEGKYIDEISFCIRFSGYEGETFSKLSVMYKLEDNIVHIFKY